MEWSSCQAIQGSEPLRDDGTIAAGEWNEVRDHSDGRQGEIRIAVWPVTPSFEGAEELVGNAGP
jgi:hypothetical protein